MNASRIVSLLEARPFKPFVVYVNMADDCVKIDDPALAKVEDEGETLIVASHRGSSSQWWTRLIDLRLVTVVAVQESKHQSDR